MTDTPSKPTLTLLSGEAIGKGDVDAIDDFYFRVTGKRMTEAERQYAAEKLANPD
jgi:hypothetical protein